jgi:O-antigen ligase
LSSLIPAGSVSSPYKKVHIDQFLAALILAAVPFGPVISFGASGRGAHVALAQVLTLVLATHLIFAKLASIRSFKTGLSFGLGLVLIMAPALFIAPDMAPAAVAYFNYSTGVVGGVVIGISWARSGRDRLGIVDVGLAAFLLLGTSQLLAGFLGASSLNSLHQNAETPWGNSNYVAACLVVGAFVLLARGLETRSLKLVLVPVIAAIALAVLTLSRGAAVSMSVGAAVLLWTAGSRPWQKAALRLFSIFLPVLAIYMVTRLEDLRYQGSSHATSNIESRLKLFDAAWRDFVESPWIGNGWISFRSVSARAVEEQSFAHNFFLSFLQIGGIFLGLLTIVTFLVLMIKAVARNSYIAPALCAAFAISMSDPFFESTVANLLTLSAVFVSLARPVAKDRGLPAHFNGKMTAPSTRSFQAQDASLQGRRIPKGRAESRPLLESDLDSGPSIA